MNDSQSPYSAPQTGMSPPPPEALSPTQSAIPKVFGIIHIVYACLGMVGAIIGVGALLAMKAIIKNVPEGQEMEGFMSVYDQMAIYTYIDAGLKVILGMMLLVAGIGLLKRKAWAQKLSITWAVARIVLAVTMVTLTYSTQMALQDEMAEISQNQSGAEFQSAAQSVGAIFGILLIAIYPVLTMIFLSRKSAKDMLN